MADRPTPTPTPDTAPFWEAAKGERLLIQRCRSCVRHYFYPRPFCPNCASADVEWDEVSGRGRLVSYVINYRPMPPTEGAEPQVIALVELEEGVRLLTNIVDTAPEPDALPLDTPVSVAFQQRGDFKLPVFRLVDAQ
ncbi:Zn-ribbon domain-containing OB-fold protein [Streptomyces sp. NPDC058683]|uniref:Zn-ribbon domain-containing OB-fold protein n=1 Tax=Streptomyces sp. NPDC058683 TaxID=3346597 RepID=UPI00366A44CD